MADERNALLEQIRNKVSPFLCLELNVNYNSLQYPPLCFENSSKKMKLSKPFIERLCLLCQSFNLKPVLAKRPMIMGRPSTNLKVVAILERANAFRQVCHIDLLRYHFIHPRIIRFSMVVIFNILLKTGCGK